MAANGTDQAIQLAGAMVGGGLALAGGAIGAAVGDGLATIRSNDFATVAWWQIKTWLLSNRIGV